MNFQLSIIYRCNELSTAHHLTSCDPLPHLAGPIRTAPKQHQYAFPGQRDHSIVRIESDTIIVSYRKTKNKIDIVRTR